MSGGPGKVHPGSEFQFWRIYTSQTPAFLNRDVFAGLDKKNKLEGWQKIKVHRQIIAIAKVADCEQILTEDEALANRARLCEIELLKVADLPIPDSAKQGELQLEEHEEIADLDQREVEEEAVSGRK